MSYRTAFFVLTLVFGVVRSQVCRTPLGVESQCISLYDCEPLVNAFQVRPLRNNVITFLKQSQCGFTGSTPTVCCGPLPEQQVTEAPPQRQVQRPVQRDPSVNPEDSVPSPRGECGTETNGDRIIGGVVTDLDEFPWMALMGYRKTNGRLTYQCGGVLLNRRFVLTAAHCIKGAVEREVGKLEVVRLGEYDTETDVDCSAGVCADPPQEIPVQAAYAHTGYADKNVNKKDDIGLVRLAGRATYNFYVKPICLVDASTRLSPNDDVFVAGWGKTLKGTNSNVKLKLLLKMFDKSECVSKFKTLGANLVDRQLCAGGEFSKDACRGDSGGPLMAFRPGGYWEAVGIVSFGFGCGRDGWPGVYTSVASYRDWILNMMSSTNV